MSINAEKNELVGLELLDHLLSFLDNNEKYLNQTLAGYFQKAINAILNKRGFDVIFFQLKKSKVVFLMGKVAELFVPEARKHQAFDPSYNK